MKFQPFDGGIKVHESHGVAVPASNWEFKDLIKKNPTKIKQWLVGGSGFLGYSGPLRFTTKEPLAKKASFEIYMNVSHASSLHIGMQESL